MLPESFDEIRTRVLTDNTAQGVLNHLKALEDNRAHVLTRWVWELLQNARDASSGFDTRLVAFIEQNESELVFRHNGDHFKIDEIAHLVYHGSTKIENPKTIGQYGSGFLTTHLLSPKIRISGKLDDGRSFEFPLKREVGSVKDLSESMEQAWSEFKGSLSETQVTNEFTTEFRYPLNDDALDAVEQGIETLMRCASLVVAFNQEFSSINIKTPDATVAFKVVERKPLEQDDLLQVKVSENKNGSLTEKQFLLAQGQKASIAVPFESSNDIKCLPLGEIPRLFLGFPIVGTDNFSFPAVINSLNFTPTENRDGVYIAQSDNEANVENQAVIEEACDLLVELLQLTASANWRNTYLLADIPSILQRDWLNPNWFRKCLEERLVQKIRHNSVVVNESSQVISPDGLELPISDTDDGVVALWDLLDGWQGAHEKLSRRDAAAGWCEAVKSWANISREEVSSFKEVMDGRKLVEERVEVECGSLEDLQGFLREHISAVKWLNQLYSFLKSNRLDDTLRTCLFVPDQDGSLDTLANLHRDQYIAEELKEIAALLGWNIRQDLRDARLTSLADESGAGDWDNNYVVGELIKKLQERADKNPDESFRLASVRLFAWIVSLENWGHLQGFPVFSEGNDSERRVFRLGRAEEGSEGTFAPVQAWLENLQSFSELFPRRHILSSAFFDAVPSAKVWQKLDKDGFLKKNVIITKQANINFNTFLPDEPLTEGSHQTVERVTITNVAFLTSDDIGIMDRVRQSRRLAEMFWHFLTKWLILYDSKGLETQKALCDCKENHHYYPSEWLVSVATRRWIPIEERRSDRATAQSLAKLLRGQGWEPGSLNENPDAIKLLDAIGITYLDLVREFGAATDEERKAQDDILTQMLVVTGGDIESLHSAHQYIEDMNKQKRMVNENQHLGNQVEKLVEQSLRDKGFDVRRTGIGSDFEIECDLVENGEEVGIEVAQNGRTWLVEVKATRGQGVRMTDTQAKKAVAEGDGFLLCVVPIEHGNTELELDDVRTAIRFVANIGERVDKLCDDLDEFKELHADITSEESSGVQLQVETGAIRVRVASSVWQNDGFPLSELSSRLLTS